MNLNTKDLFLRKIDFYGDSSISYRNPLMRGLRYRILYDKYMMLEPAIGYSDYSEGGFDLVGLTMSDESILVVQFY